MSQFRDMVQEVYGDFPYDTKSEQYQKEQQEARAWREKEIADAWANVEHDISYAKHAMWTTEEDLKLLRAELGIK